MGGCSDSEETDVTEPMIGRRSKRGRQSTRSTVSNHLRTMVIHEQITADLFTDDDDTYTDPSIPCSGSTVDELKGHRVDNRTMIVHKEHRDHRSRRQTTESELTATAATGISGMSGNGHSTLLSPSNGGLADHGR